MASDHAIAEKHASSARHSHEVSGVLVTLELLLEGTSLEGPIRLLDDGIGGIGCAGDIEGGEANGVEENKKMASVMCLGVLRKMMGVGGNRA